MTTPQQDRELAELLQDPHSRYADLRAAGQVHRVVTPQGMRLWLVTGYAAARHALADPRLGKDFTRNQHLFDHHGSGAAWRSTEVLSSHMLNNDPPRHTRLRKLVAGVFTPSRVDRLRPRIERISASLLDAVAEEPEFDLVERYAFPLPIMVICELLGLPTQDRQDFRAWSENLVAAGTVDPLRVQQAATAITRYFADLVAHKRDHPGDDVVSALIEARDAADRLAEEELISTVFLLLIAGFETAVNLIGNGMLALLTHPDQYDTLRAAPELVPGAVDELLRFDGPVNTATWRFTTEPVTIGDVGIPAGEIVRVAVLSANRDSERFPDPDRLDVRRDARGHLAFGHGVHHCVGARLGRLEAEVAFLDLLTRFDRLELAAGSGEPVRSANLLINGVKTLPVRGLLNS